ncbi:MAG: hypothetical protein DWP94_00760 [Flavobacterium sp.]|nr:MAG: hypothetical protein DWP94_00760 [Flavobacterium sp.]
MDKNKTGKYLKYAIGEIVLVVIGILIALSINNWNENRKLKSEELNLLSDIKTNLLSTYNTFKNDSILNQRDILRYEKIEYYIEKDLKYNIELDSAFGVLTFWSTPYITTTAYNTLQTKGLDLIKNERLRQDIAYLYEVELKSLVEDYDRSEWKISETVTPFFSKHIKRLHKRSLNDARPNDFESLKRNDEFQNILSMIIRQRKRGQVFFSDVMLGMQSLIEDIEIEIDSRK